MVVGVAGRLELALFCSKGCSGFWLSAGSGSGAVIFWMIESVLFVFSLVSKAGLAAFRSIFTVLVFRVTMVAVFSRRSV